MDTTADITRGRGRGRGLHLGGGDAGELGRTELRRPLAMPQDIAVSGALMQHAAQQQQQNVAVNATAATQQFLAAKQIENAYHMQQQQQMFYRQQQSQQQQQHQSLPTVVNQPQPNPQQLQFMLQQAHLQQQQQTQLQQQRQQQHQMSLQQQLYSSPGGNSATAGNASGANSGAAPISYLSPQKQQEYSELQRTMQLMELQKRQQAAQQLQQHYMRNSNHQQQQLNQAAQNLEIEQKLASLQIQQPQGSTTNPQNVMYMLPDQQQQQMQAQHHMTQQQAQQDQMQQASHDVASRIPTSGVQQDEGMKASMLSVDAAEFVPQISNSPQQQHGSSAQQPEPCSLIAVQLEYSCHPVVLQVDSAVVQLSGNPSKYEAICRQLTSVLSWQVKEEALMREVVTVIFEQGVGEANFRYHGGKLCEHLVHHLAQQYNGLTFKSILLQRCQEEYEHRQQYLAMGYIDRLTGYTFFLAEILTRLLTPSGLPIIKLREAMCDMLAMLLDVATNDTLKCVAQVLKMTGKYLEMGTIPAPAGSTPTDDKNAVPGIAVQSSSSNKEVEEVMSKVRELTMTHITANIKALLLSVVEFRASNWGCPTLEQEEANAAAAAEAQKSSENNNAEGGDTNAVNGLKAGNVATATDGSLPVLGTVFYTPDGVIHHIEEDCPDEASEDETNKQSAQVYELDREESAYFDRFLKSME